jgi:hypothetical protein
MIRCTNKNRTYKRKFIHFLKGFNCNRVLLIQEMTS